MRSKFEPSGSLPRPGWIGRVVRLVLGIACLQFFWVLVTDGRAIATAPAAPSHFGWSFGVAVALYVTSYVVNIGFGLDLGRGPQYSVIAAALVCGVWGYLATGQLWSAQLGWLLVVWLAYVFAHLGVSFVISSLLATPGCEMRGIPHLYSRLTGRDTAEHFCPGPLRFVDEWERGGEPS